MPAGFDSPGRACGMSQKPTRDEFQKLVEKVESLEDEHEETKDELQEERERRREAERERDELEERVKKLEDGRQYLIQDIVELEERLEDGDLAADVEQNADPTVERETPLEDVVSLPVEVAQSSLSENERRARFIAMNPRDYGDRVPVGRRLTAGRIGRTLRAGLDVDPHPETVRRVMQLLDDLGGDQTTRRKMDGEKRIVLEEGLVDRLERLSALEGQAHDVVSEVPG